MQKRGEDKDIMGEVTKTHEAILWAPLIPYEIYFKNLSVLELSVSDNFSLELFLWC